MDMRGSTDAKGADRSTSKLKMMKMLGVSPDELDKLSASASNLLLVTKKGSTDNLIEDVKLSIPWKWPSTYLFATPDTANNICFEDSAIRGATVVKLVEKLTSPEQVDPSYLFEFLLTYRSFTTPKELVKMLTTRWLMPIPPEVQADEKELDAFQKTIMKPIRLRIFNVVKKWIDDHWYDFEADSTLTDDIRDLIKEIGTQSEQIATTLNKLLAKKAEGAGKGTHLVFDKPAPESHNVNMKLLTGATSHLAFLAFHPEEIARQMTLIESALFRSIKPWECTGQAWAKHGKETKAPHILGMILRFNKVSIWVKNTVVQTEDVQARGEVLSHFIDIITHLRAVNNFNGIMEVLAGLRSAAIHRLRKSWDLVSSSRLKIFDELTELMSPTSNYTKFRTVLHKDTSPPCIPYLGVYLTDLTFIEDGNPDTIDHGLINFDKRRRIAAVIGEIKQYQQTPYHFNEVRIIQGFLLAGGEYADENQVYRLSLELEPKGSYDSSKKKPMLKKTWSFKSRRSVIRSSVKRLDPLDPNNASGSPVTKAMSIEKLKSSGHSSNNGGSPEESPISDSSLPESGSSLDSDNPLNRTDRSVSVESDHDTDEIDEIPFDMLISYLLQGNNAAFEKYLENFDYYQAELIRSQTIDLLKKRTSQ